MRSIDFDAHNEEVRRVWEAYRSGRPIRPPMILGINVRYTMWRSDANHTGIGFERYFTDPDAMLLRQLEHKAWVRRHVPQDSEMGLPTAGWDVQVDFQNSYEAGWFGCPVRFFDGEVPDTEPQPTGEADKRNLIERGLPDPFEGGLMERNWAFYEHFLRRRVDDFLDALAAAAHAHVERRIEAEREAARRIVELHRRDAEIESNAVDLANAVRRQQLFHFAEAALDQSEPAGEAFRQRGAVLDRRRVAVDGADAALRRFEQATAIAAGAEGGIDIDRTVARCQAFEHFGQHDRRMAGFGGVGCRAGDHQESSPVCIASNLAGASAMASSRNVAPACGCHI